MSSGSVGGSDRRRSICVDTRAIPHASQDIVSRDGCGAGSNCSGAHPPRAGGVESNHLSPGEKESNLQGAVLETGLLPLHSPIVLVSLCVGVGQVAGIRRWVGVGVGW